MCIRDRNNGVDKSQQNAEDGQLDDNQQNPEGVQPDDSQQKAEGVQPDDNQQNPGEVQPGNNQQNAGDTQPDVPIASPAEASLRSFSIGDIAFLNLPEIPEVTFPWSCLLYTSIIHREGLLPPTWLRKIKTI